MNLRKFFGIQTSKEKIEDYRRLKSQLGELDMLGQELSDKFSIQKSIIDGVDGLPEQKKSEVFEKYKVFLKDHQKEVSTAVNDRNKILKSLDNYRNDPEVGQVCKDIDTLENVEVAYQDGKLAKQAYFDIVKSLTGEPVKYADVVAFDKNGRFLILHRVKDFTPTGEVCIPGGHVDPGEDFETAALRELKEETNLDPISGMGITCLGEYKSADVHIKYYKVFIDCDQPVTVDATEHCFHEFIDLGEIPLKPFIFDQGKNIINFIMNPQTEMIAEPLMKALNEGRIAPEAFASGLTSILKKAVNIEVAKPLVPESLDGDKRKLAVPVRDPLRCVETIMKGISGHHEITVGENVNIKFVKPLVIHDTRYKEDPATNRLTECEIVYSGDDTDMLRLLEEMKYSLMVGSLKVRTAHEEFMTANERGTDYVGDPIFVAF